MAALSKEEIENEIAKRREALSRITAQNSLYEFVKQAWPQIEGDTPFLDGWHIQAICEHLEATLMGDIKKLLINVPPRTSKTSIISIMFPAWVWCRFPSIRFVYASHSRALSHEHSRNCRTLIESHWYQTRWGDVYQLSKDQSAKGHFSNNKLGYRVATSIGASTTGWGGDVLVLDDPNDAQKGESEAMRTAANEFVSRVWPSRLNPGGLGINICVQQRIHEKEVTGYLLERDKDWTTLILPMEFEVNRRAKTIILPSSNGKIWEDPRTQEGELLWPAGLPKEKIEKRKIELGPYTYAGQYQQRPSPAEGGIIKGYWFRKWEKPQPPKLIRVIQSLDTAFEEKDTNNYSAILTFGLFEDEHKFMCLMLLNLWRGKLNYPNLRDLCKNLYDDYRNDGTLDIKPDGHHQVDMMLVEAKANGTSLIQDLRKAGINAHKFLPDKHGDKLQRVVLASSLIAEGLVYVPMMPPDFKRYRPTSQTLLDLCKVFPNSDSRDVVDCLSQAILYFMTSGILRHRFDKDVWASLGRKECQGLYNDINPI